MSLTLLYEVGSAQSAGPCRRFMLSVPSLTVFFQSVQTNRRCSRLDFNHTVRDRLGHSYRFLMQPFQ